MAEALAEHGTQPVQGQARSSSSTERGVKRPEASVVNVVDEGGSVLVSVRILSAKRRSVGVQTGDLDAA